MSEQEAPVEEVKEEVQVEAPVVEETKLGEYDAPIDFDGPEEGLVPDPVVEEEVEEVAEVDPWEELLPQAERYGFTADDAKAYGTPDAFERAMVALDRQAAKFGRDKLKSWEQEATKPAPVAGPVVEKAEPKAKVDYKKYEIKLDPEVYEEETLKTLNGLNDHYDEIVRKQQEKLALQEEVLIALAEKHLQSTGKQDADESQKLETDLDTFFDSLDDGFKDTFGKGAARLLQPTSPQMVARNELLEEMRVLDIADAQAERPRQTYQELAKRALRSLHFDKIKTSVRKEIVEKTKTRQSQQISRPSGHNGKPKGKLEQAIARVEEAYRAKGFRTEDWEEEVEF